VFFGEDGINTSFDIFKIRYTLDAELGEKHLRKYEKEIEKDFKKRIEKETDKIKLRTIQYVEEFLKLVENDLEKKVTELKSKDRLSYYRWLDENRRYLEKVTNEASNDKNTILEKIVDLEKDNKELDYRLAHLFSQIISQLTNTFSVIKKTLVIEKYSSRKTHITKVVKCFAAFFLIILRIIEIHRHWDKSDEKQKTLIENIVHWDLDSINQLTQQLPPMKKKLTEKELKEHIPDPELVKAFWG